MAFWHLQSESSTYERDITTLNLGKKLKLSWTILPGSICFGRSRRRKTEVGEQLLVKSVANMYTNLISTKHSHRFGRLANPD